VGITKDTEIEALLNRLADEIRHNTKGSLVGLYVYGSLVTGDFDKYRSDVDLLAIVDPGVEDDTFERLDKMHARFIEEYPAWEDRIEVAYVPVLALRTFRTETSRIAVISPGEPFHFKSAGKDWLLNWYVVRDVGVTLYGPPPDALIPDMSQPEFVEAVRVQVETWKEWVYRMRTPGAQSYAVLTLCRALYTHTNGGQASKKQAALWAAERMPEWESLIQQSVAWMSEGPRDESDDVEGLSERVRFVHDVADRITGPEERSLDTS